MQTKIEGNLIFIRLFPNEDLFKKLEKVCLKYKIEVGIIISGIGQFKNFELGYFKEKGNYCPEKFLKPYELLSLNGNIIKQPVSSGRGKEYKFHLHAVMAGEDKKVIGGHLLKAKVEVTNEIVLLKCDLPAGSLKRKIEKKTGLEGLFLEK